MYYGSTNKYKNRKITNKYGTFDSKKEYERFLILQDMEKRGEITDLKRQVPFELIPSQRIQGKVVERAVTYKADYTYYKGNEYIVEDVKSAMTKKLPEYILKRKMMLYLKGIRIREV